MIDGLLGLKSYLYPRMNKFRFLCLTDGTNCPSDGPASSVDVIFGDLEMKDYSNLSAR